MYYIHIPPNNDLHFLLFGKLIFTCHILRPNARSSGDLFWTYGTFWLPFLYAPAHVDLLSISTTYSLPSLYSSQFYVRFCIFTSPWWGYYMGDILWITCARSSGDLFCTYTSSLWPILHFLTAYSVHTSVHVDIFSISTYYLFYISFYSLFCLFYFFWRAYIYLRYFMTCTYLWWTIMYTSLIFVTYSLHIELFEFLFCVETSLCFTYFLQVLPLNDLVCTLLIFRTDSVHIHSLFDILYTRNILMDYSVHIPSLGDLFCT